MAHELPKWDLNRLEKTKLVRFELYLCFKNFTVLLMRVASFLEENDVRKAFYSQSAEKSNLQHRIRNAILQQYGEIIEDVCVTLTSRTQTNYKSFRMIRSILSGRNDSSRRVYLILKKIVQVFLYYLNTLVDIANFIYFAQTKHLGYALILILIIVIQRVIVYNYSAYEFRKFSICFLDQICSFGSKDLYNERKDVYNGLEMVMIHSVPIQMLLCK